MLIGMRLLNGPSDLFLLRKLKLMSSLALQLPFATPPDILRSVQKDEYYLLETRRRLSAIFTGFFGKWMASSQSTSISAASSDNSYVRNSTANEV